MTNEAMDTGSNKTPGRKKPGPKPKQITEATYTGLPVGRHNVVVDPNEVRKLAALGCKNKDIANFFGVTEDAISSNFAAELVKGREEVKISLRRAMLENACVKHNAAVQIFLAKNMLGMTDNPLDTDDNKVLPWTDDADDSPKMDIDD
jgi:hypothetical protein